VGSSADAAVSPCDVVFFAKQGMGQHSFSVNICQLYAQYVREIYSNYANYMNIKTQVLGGKGGYAICLCINRHLWQQQKSFHKQDFSFNIVLYMQDGF
jgi:hypothetical protein